MARTDESSTRGDSDAARARHYVGDDRRHAPATFRVGDARILAVSVVAAVVVWGLLELAVATQGRTLGGVDEQALGSLINTVIAVLGAVVGALVLVLWRMTGLTRPVWIGAGVLLFAGVAVGIGHLVPELLETDTELLDAFTVGGSAVAALLVGVGAVVPEVDTRLRFRWLFSATGLAAAATAVLLDALNAAEVLTGATGQWILVSAWASVAGVHLLAPGQRRTRTHLTVAAAASALVLAELTHVLALGTPESSNVVWGILGAMALGLILAQVLRDLEAVYFHQRGRLFESEVSVQTAAAQRRADEALDAERAHDAKNALLAIEGAALTLERYRDRLDPARRASLSAALSAEIQRMRGLVDVQRHREEHEAFDLVELVTPIAGKARERGLMVDLDLPRALSAVGRSGDTSEVLHSLLDNARRHAPGSPVRIRGEIDGEWAVLYVEDRGAGVARADRERIFEPPSPADASGRDQDGLGLFVCRKLMVAQQGDMWLDHRPGGGASFGICLPLASRSAGAQEPGGGASRDDESAVTGGVTAPAVGHQIAR